MYLEKEDVSLYYETYGEGEPLILIHGVIVDAQLYQEAARLLSRYYQVILYDRRGNSRSRLKGEKDFSMDDQADDIRDPSGRAGSRPRMDRGGPARVPLWASISCRSIRSGSATSSCTSRRLWATSWNMTRNTERGRST